MTILASSISGDPPLLMSSSLSSPVRSSKSPEPSESAVSFPFDGTSPGIYFCKWIYEFVHVVGTKCFLVPVVQGRGAKEMGVVPRLPLMAWLESEEKVNMLQV